MPRLLVDISAHGFGHLGQTAPVINALHLAVSDWADLFQHNFGRERIPKSLPRS